MRHPNRKLLLTAAAALGVPVFAMGQVDNVVSLISENNATGGKAISAYGFNPNTNAFYVSSNGFSGTGDNAVLRLITNVDDLPNQTSALMVSESAILLYYRDGDNTRGVTNPTIGGMALNPLPIVTDSGTLPAYSVAYIQDAQLTRQPLSTTVTDPAATKRFYRWNLEAVGPGSIPGPPFGDARDVMTTVTTLQQVMSAAGSTNTTSLLTRQFAYSGDGQSIYAIDSSAALGGLYRIRLSDNTITQLTALSDANTEPAVLSSGGVDTVFFRGGTPTNNVGGIDKITYDGTNVGARTIHVSAETINDFFELTTGNITNFSMASDADGSLYFTDATSSGPRKGVYRLDSQGRIAKVLGYEERQSVFASETTGGTVNANTLRMQFRDASFGIGPSAFPVRQLMYIETSGVNAVAGAYLFKTGDFDRDNDVDQADIELFKSALTLESAIPLSGTVAGDQPKLKFDLNGNNVVSWKDVKILQRFYAFPNGDADINKTVNLDDFTALAANFGLSGKRWLEGDFNGDESVTLDDFTILAANFGTTSPGGLASRSTVPEPSAAALAVAGASLVLRRNRSKRRD